MLSPQKLFNALDTDPVLQPQESVEELAKALDNQQNVHARRAAVRMLGYIGGGQAVDLLLAALQDRDEGVCIAAIASLGRIADPRTALPLCRVLSSGHPILHPYAAQALGEIGDPQAVDVLIGALQGTGHRVRTAAMKALAQIGERRAIGPLVTALGDGDPCIRLVAAAALSQMCRP